MLMMYSVMDITTDGNVVLFKYKPRAKQKNRREPPFCEDAIKIDALSFFYHWEAQSISYFLAKSKL